MLTATTQCVVKLMPEARFSADWERDTNNNSNNMKGKRSGAKLEKKEVTLKQWNEFLLTVPSIIELQVALELRLLASSKDVCNAARWKGLPEWRGC